MIDDDELLDLYSRVCEAISGVRREGQERLLRAVARAIADNGILVAEAATGIGKTIAYLVPIFAGGRRAVIATATKALQSQLVEKDIPVVARCSSRRSGHRVALIKGRHNYVCLAKVLGKNEGLFDPAALRRLRQLCASSGLYSPSGPGSASEPASELGSASGPDSPSELDSPSVLDPAWQGDPSFDGDVEKLHTYGIALDEAAEFLTDSVECVGVPDRRKCRWGEVCYFERAFTKALQADVVVTNHHFLPTLLGELAKRASAGDDAEPPVLIVDEAHRLESALRSGEEVSEGFVVWLSRAVGRMFPGLREASAVAAQARSAFAKCRRHAASDPDQAALLLGEGARERATELGLEDDPELLEEAQSDTMKLVLALEALRRAMVSRLSEKDARRQESRASEEVLKGRVRLVEAVIETLKSATGPRDDAWLAWLEFQKRETRARAAARSQQGPVLANDGAGSVEPALNGARVGTGSEANLQAWRVKRVPLDVAEAALGLFSCASAIVLTSGTLCDSTGFARFATSLGLKAPEHEWSSKAQGEDAPVERVADGVRYMKLGSPFDLASQALLYCPSALPSPDHELWATEVLREIVELVRIADGGALLLFTSLAAMSRAYEALDRELAGFEVLVQGSDTPSALATRFLEAKGRGVLLASRTFWEGVDFAGPSLRLVVMDRLPFPSPKDPVAAALSKRIDDAGGSSFRDFSLPSAVSAFRQGLGRLIRSEDDYGVVALLDSRLHSRRYGWAFVQAALPVPLTTDRAEVEEFFRERRSQAVR